MPRIAGWRLTHIGRGVLGAASNALALALAPALIVCLLLLGGAWLVFSGVAEVFGQGWARISAGAIAFAVAVIAARGMRG